MIADSIAYLRRMGREVIYDAEHFFDGWKANPEYACAARSRPRPKPARRLVVLCDTNGGNLPEKIAELTRGRQRVAEGAGGHPLP